MRRSGWIACDLDGTLAYYDGLKGPEYIGKPIPLMLERVQRWLEMGYTVKIFTARASDPKQIPIIQKWLAEVGLPELEITNVKDYQMQTLWDDRCIQVIPNTGLAVTNG